MLHTFVLNKSFGQLLDILPKRIIPHSKFSCIEVWFTDQNYKRLEIEDKINISLVIN